MDLSITLSLSTWKSDRAWRSLFLSKHSESSYWKKLTFISSWSQVTTRLGNTEELLEELTSFLASGHLFGTHKIIKIKLDPKDITCICHSPGLWEVFQAWGICQPQIRGHRVLAGDPMFESVKCLLNWGMNGLGVRECVVLSREFLGVPKSPGDRAEWRSWQWRRYYLGLPWILQDAALCTLGDDDDVSQEAHKTNVRLVWKWYVVRSNQRMVSWFIPQENILLSGCGIL